MPTTQQSYPTPHAPIPSIQLHARQPIHLSCPIPADIRRVFCAISLPEYLEAWLRPPHPAEQLDFYLGTPQRLHIDLSRDGAHRCSIHTSIHILDRNHVGYTWTAITRTAIARTAVDLRLASGPAGCRIDLTHSGLHPLEQEWHSRMWKRSIEKLCAIVTAPSQSPTRQRPMPETIPAAGVPDSCG